MAGTGAHRGARAGEARFLAGTTANLSDSSPGSFVATPGAVWRPIASSLLWRWWERGFALGFEEIELVLPGFQSAQGGPFLLLVTGGGLGFAFPRP